MKWLRKQIYAPNAPIGTQKFDGDTGQIYNETTVAIQTKDDRGWHRSVRCVVGPSYQHIEDHEAFVKRRPKYQTTGDLGDFKNYSDNVKNSKVRGLRGARSLQDAAIECILHNISDITLEGIECLPVHIVRRLWHAINQRCTACFNTWRIFATILRRESDITTLKLLHFRHNISEPTSPLLIYTTPVTSKSFEFLTSLSITASFSVPGLCGLSSIRNLGVLEVINTSYSNRMLVCDRVVRAWHLAALNEGAFQVLRILKLSGYDEVTDDTLAWLNSFPALAVFEVWNSAIVFDAATRARKIGWDIIRDRHALDILDELCMERVSSIKLDLADNKMAEYSYSRPLPDDSSVKMVPRTGLLVKPEQNQKISGGAKRSRGLQDDAKKSKKRLREEPWDFKPYSTFARIGELRQDSDLAKAGVDIGQQAVAGNQVVSSVPLVSLCIGSRQPLASRSTLGALVFVRIQISEPKTAKQEEGRTSTTAQPGTRIKPSRRLTHKVLKTKKRNLDEMLNAFM